MCGPTLGPTPAPAFVGVGELADPVATLGSMRYVVHVNGTVVTVIDTAEHLAPTVQRIDDADRRITSILQSLLFLWRETRGS